MSVLRSSVIISIVTLMSACGFHLRGAVSTEGLSSVYLSGATGGALAVELARVLERADVQVAQSSDAQMWLQLGEEEQRQRSLTASDRGRTLEYELTTVVTYGIGHAGDSVTDLEALSRRTLVLDRDNLIGTSQEEQQIRREMRAEIIEQIVRSLGAAAR